MGTRRENLKIIGAIGATCAFPFAADELYGQEHSHAAASPAAAAVPYKLRFFTKEEFATISSIAECIIPATDTPGAIAAGAPQYIDSVVAGSKELQKRCRAGLSGIERRFEKPFSSLDEADQTAYLTELNEKADPFFVTMKSLTADGYYTSKIGLVDELGYKGNTALASFPGCNDVHEH